jgi:membrane protease YdiL (CAAX protease family)
VLSAAPFVQHLTAPGPVLPPERFGIWAAAVTGVAVAEEVLLRGGLWRAVLRATSRPAAAPWTALAVTTVAFAALHVPFYGLGSLPVDLAAGLLLGALRQWTGTVTAPAVAHLAADLAGWWLQ